MGNSFIEFYLPSLIRRQEFRDVKDLKLEIQLGRIEALKAW